MSNLDFGNFAPINSCLIGVIGLGYVGLPLSLEFAKTKKCLRTQKSLNRKVIGFDLNNERIKELKNGIDSTKETEESDLKKFKNIKFTSNINDLIEADIYIISVPTPITKQKKPDLSCLKKASKSVGEILKKRISKFKPIVIYESTVYPGTTEEFCISIIERESNLTSNKDFYYGYSPERINPGDKNHRLTSIVKITSGSNQCSSAYIDQLYGSIIEAGTFKAVNIKIAETAKVIENTQRDLNIALVNELAKICKTLNIDTLDVLNAAESKWNFLPFRPGLVGGHCISVDPYYLTYIAKKQGFKPNVVLAGRKINDEMSKWIFDQIIIATKDSNLNINTSKILILGCTFKENTPDTRNSQVFEIIKMFNGKKLKPYLYDPYIKHSIGSKDYCCEILDELPLNNRTKFNIILVAVGHEEFKTLKIKDWEILCDKHCIIYDIKGIVPRGLNPLRL